MKAHIEKVIVSLGDEIRNNDYRLPFIYDAVILLLKLELARIAEKEEDDSVEGRETRGRDDE